MIEILKFTTPVMELDVPSGHQRFVKQPVVTTGVGQVGVKRTDENGNEFIVCWSKMTEFSGEPNEKSLKIQFNYFTKMNGQAYYFDNSPIFGFVNNSMHRIGNPANPDFAKLCESSHPDALGEYDFFSMVFMSGEFISIGLPINYFLALTILKQMGWEHPDYDLDVVPTPEPEPEP